MTPICPAIASRCVPVAPPPHCQTFQNLLPVHHRTIKKLFCLVTKQISLPRVEPKRLVKQGKTSSHSFSALPNMRHDAASKYINVVWPYVESRLGVASRFI